MNKELNFQIVVSGKHVNFVTVQLCINGLIHPRWTLQWSSVTMNGKQFRREQPSSQQVDLAGLWFLRRVALPEVFGLMGKDSQSRLKYCRDAMVSFQNP